MATLVEYINWKGSLDFATSLYNQEHYLLTVTVNIAICAVTREKVWLVEYGGPLRTMTLKLLVLVPAGTCQTRRQSQTMLYHSIIYVYIICRLKCNKNTIVPSCPQ
jgi:hypothetical protein